LNDIVSATHLFVKYRQGIFIHKYFDNIPAS